MGERERPAARLCDAGEVAVRMRFPDPQLQGYVTFYYFVDSPGPLEDFLYPEWGAVRIALTGSWRVESRQVRSPMPWAGAIFGPTDRAFRFGTDGGTCAGFGLTPLGWQRLLGGPAELLANRITDLHAELGLGAPAIRDALLARAGDERAGGALFDRLLLDRLAASAPNTADALAADRTLRDRPPDVRSFAARAGLSEAALRTVCKGVFGFGPKRLLRRQRFLDTLGRIRTSEAPRFARLLDPSYFDQAHFNHEFHEFMGVSPREYLSAPRPLMAPAARAQQRMGVPLNFTLPPQPVG